MVAQGASRQPEKARRPPEWPEPTAIARDAAGRGLSVLLVEQSDLAQATSSASTKLIHGGLRYLEYREFRLVREALAERETMLRIAPHLVRPMRFLVPPGPASRPWWMVRIGLWLYDWFGRGGSLPPSRGIKLPGGRGFAYWDAKVDDSRLVILNALDAAEHGAAIATRTQLASARREGGRWLANVENMADGAIRRVSASAIVNAAGPWVGEVLGERLAVPNASRLRLIKGSHIIVPRLFEAPDAWLLQQPDGRVVFAIPHEEHFTLIGTTDVPVDTPDPAGIEPAEIDYLCAAVNRYFPRSVDAGDVVATYSGIRALHDDGAADSKAVTRDYRLELDVAGAPLLSLFGGKITTARALAEEAVDRILHALHRGGAGWTGGRPLPGGDIDRLDAFLDDARAHWPFLDETVLRRMASAYGSRLVEIMGDAASAEDLGRDFGCGLSQAEVDYLVRREWARTPEDILWRRSKLGLRASPETIDMLRVYLEKTCEQATA